MTRYLRQRLTPSAPGLFGESLAITGQTLCPNEQLLRETQMRFLPLRVGEHQFRLHGHVARFPDANSAQQILSVRGAS